MISATMVGANDYIVTVEAEGGPGNDDHEFRVTLDAQFYQQLCAGGVTHEWVLVQSFRFLLEREAVGAILPRFDLRQVSDYFPEFVDTLQAQLAE